MKDKIVSSYLHALELIRNNPQPDSKEQSWKLVPKDLSDALTKETLTKLGIRKLNQFEQDALDKAFLDSLLDKPTLKRK